MATGRHREQCVPTHANIRHLPIGVGVVNYMLYYVISYCIILYCIILYKKRISARAFAPARLIILILFILVQGKTYNGHGSSP